MKTNGYKKKLFHYCHETCLDNQEKHKKTAQHSECGLVPQPCPTYLDVA